MKRYLVAVATLAGAILLAQCGRGLDTGACQIDAWKGTRETGATSSSTTLRGVATDASCNVYISGATGGNLDGNTLSGVGSVDLFVSQYNSLGVKQWTRQMGVSGKLTWAYGVAADSANGYVYAGGTTTGGLDGNALTGSQDYFVTQYNLLGVKQWTKQYGASGATIFMNWGAVATDASGHVYVVGSTDKALDGNSMTGSRDAFVAQYDSSGNLLWLSQLGVSGQTTYGYALAVSSSGQVYVAGSTTGNLDGNSPTVTEDSFVAQYNSSGAKQWVRQKGITGVHSFAQGAAADRSGTVAVAGVTNGGFDGNTLIGTQDAFLIVYDSSGAKQWSKQIGVSGQVTDGYGAAADTSGDFYAVGYTSGNLEGIALTGTQDEFVTAYSGAGTHLWTKLLGAVGASCTAYGVATDASRDVFTAGTTSAGLDGNTLIGTQDSTATEYSYSGAK